MKLFCKGQHWEIKDKQLILVGDDETVARMTAVIEAKVRLKIYDEICALNLTTQRKQLMKNGLENVALTVQDMCAEIAIGK